MAVAHAVEGRFPFLDHRVIELGCRIPPWHKLFGLKEKYVLKKAMRAELPKEITQRVKQPYMAPDSNSFFQDKRPAYIAEMFSETNLKKSGVFNAEYVARLIDKCSRLSHAHLSFKDNMSFIGILSTQLLLNRFIEHFTMPEPLSVEAFTVWKDESTL